MSQKKCQSEGAGVDLPRRLQKNMDFFVLAQASFLTFGKVNPASPSPDWHFLGGRGSLLTPQPHFCQRRLSLRLSFFWVSSLIFVSAGLKTETS